MFHPDTDSRQGVSGLMKDIERRSQPAGEFLFRYDPGEDAPIWGFDDRVLHLSGEGLMVVSRTGVGKTTFVGQLILRRLGVFSDPLLDLPVRPLDDGEVVLYIGADRPKQIRRSFHRMVTAENEALLDERMIFWRGPLPFLINRESTQLEALVQQMEAKYDVRIAEVVIDSLKDVASDLNKDEGGSGVSRTVRDLTANNREVIICHHQRKGERSSSSPSTLDDVYGSALLTAAMGNVIYLDGVPGGAHVDLRHFKSSRGEIDPMHLSLDHATGRFSIRKSGDLLDILRVTPGGMTVRAACFFLYDDTEPDANTVEKVRRKLDKYVGDDLARKVVPGPGQAAVYYAIETPEEQ